MKSCVERDFKIKKKHMDRGNGFQKGTFICGRRGKRPGESTPLIGKNTPLHLAKNTYQRNTHFQLVPKLGRFMNKKKLSINL